MRSEALKHEIIQNIRKLKNRERTFTHFLRIDEIQTADEYRIAKKAYDDQIDLLDRINRQLAQLPESEHLAVLPPEEFWYQDLSGQLKQIDAQLKTLQPRFVMNAEKMTMKWIAGET